MPVPPPEDAKSSSSKKIEGMIQEELDKMSPEEKAELASRGTKRLEVRGDKIEEVDEVDEVDEAIDAIMDKKESGPDSAKLADIGADYARKVQLAFEKGGKGLDAVVGEFVAKAGELGASEAEAKAVLKAQLKEYHDTYQEAGLKEKAAEIDAFARSLESRSDVATEAGREFLRRLEAGEFDSIVEANMELDKIAKSAKGAEADALNAEFNVLFAKAQDYFEGPKSGQQGKLEDFSEDDIDAALNF